MLSADKTKGNPYLGERTSLMLSADKTEGNPYGVAFSVVRQSMGNQSAAP